MMIEATKLINLPIAAVDTESKIGVIANLVIDPENGTLMGFLVSTGNLIGGKKVLSAVDIRDWDPNGIVTSSAENIVSIDEIVRIKQVVDQKIFLLGMSAKTENNKGLGKVEDLLIDTDTQSVVKYYLKDLLGKERVISSNNVLKIDKQVIFKDDTAEVPPSAQSAVA
jgi:uncharacterized protein YrrD